MEDEDNEDVKINMSLCPECGSAIRVAVVHEMTAESIKEFLKEVMQHDLDVKTISLEEYRSSDIKLYCKDNCSKNNRIIIHQNKL